ncbi:nuclear protein localization protein 4 homolog [Cydia splendana]|uniref:nuclear protein localization protein 4 homolog n=1 Tax=Cydia splendana TaxID=1100963 RepID=UPI0028F48A22
MSGSNKLTLRVQSAEGTTRVDMSSGDVTAALYERVHDALHLRSFAFALHRDRAKTDELVSSKSQRLCDAGLRHGDMLYLSPVNGAIIFEPSDTAQATTAGPSHMEAGPSTPMDAAPPAPSKNSKQTNKPAEDELDLQLYQMPGHIQRQRDPKLCRHNSAGCCVHCSPLEPWDEGYLREHNIKHMSFHSYLRKITSGKFVSLTEPNLTIKPGCTEHPPWPRGICSKCAPGALTLNRQPFRFVDNVLVESAAVVERFLGYWRASGHQRVGYLIGQYEHHPLVPLGIRARVEAIYEPPQTSSRDHVTIAPDPKGELVDHICSKLGLRRVGWLFTDLLPLPDKPGQVQCTRGVDTHFLSAQECIMAAHFQNEHPNACRHADSGYYGSKFVTVAVTGDSTNQIHLEGYQVSAQAQALERCGLLLPTRDAPDLGYVRDPTPDRPVPDVYYKEKDAYGNEVSVSLRRVPVAYLLVDVPCGVSTNASPLLSPRAAFPPAHRPLPQYLQTREALHKHLEESESFLEAMSDLHTLVYIASNETLPIPLEALDALLAAVRARDALAAERWRADTPAWATLEHLCATQDDQMAASVGDDSGVWTCGICTFHNSMRRDACEMCAMPRGTSNAM